MWKKPSTLTNSIAPSSTPKAIGSDISSTTDSIITNDKQNVKSPTATINNNMQKQEGNTLSVLKGHTQGQYEKGNQPIISDNADQMVEMKSVDELSKYADRGGYRTLEEIETLKKDIGLQGIKYPIELTKKDDGSIKIYNGHHKFKMAQKLSIKEVPVIYVEDYINKVENDNKKLYNGIEGGEDLSGTNKNANNVVRNIKKSRNITRNDKNNNVLSKYREATTNDDKLFTGNGESNNRSSSISRNNENNLLRAGLNNSSFSLPKENKLAKYLTTKLIDKGYYVDKKARQSKNKELSSV